MNHGGMNKKQVQAANEPLYTAVYFKGDRRISTYGRVCITKASMELIRLTIKEQDIVSMLLIEEGKLPIGMVSWDRVDYFKYIPPISEFKL